MNTIRMIAIALPIMLLIACGGGGSGGSAATPTTRPANPLTVFMPAAGSSSMQAIQAITGTADAKLLLNVYQADDTARVLAQAVSCTSGNNCSFALPSIGSVNFALENNAPNLSLFNESLGGDPAQITNGQTFNGVTLARGSLSGMKNNIPVEFQTFAGWVDGNIFGITQAAIGASGSEQYRFIPYEVSDSVSTNPAGNPTGTGRAIWEGATVASIKADRTFIRGDANVTIADLSSPSVNVLFDNWHTINGQAMSDMEDITYNGLTPDGGIIFDYSNGVFEAVFHGANHTEITGTYNTETIAGAFGAKLQ